MFNRIKNKKNTHTYSDQLFLYAQRGEIDNIKKALLPIEQGGKGASIHQKDASGNTVLHHAAAFGRTNIFRELINEFSLSPKEKNYAGSDPLLVAIANGQVKMFIELEDKNGDYQLPLNVRNKANSGALLTAAASGEVVMFQLLADVYKLPLNDKNKNGHGPLELTVINNKVDMFKLLVLTKKEGGYELPIDNLDYLLDLAVKKQHKNIFNCLIEHGISTKLSNLELPEEFTKYILFKYGNNFNLNISELYINVLRNIITRKELILDDFVKMKALLQTLNKFDSNSDQLLINLFMQEFDIKMDTNIEHALSFVISMFNGYDPYPAELNCLLSNRCKIMLNHALDNPAENTPKTTLEMLIDTVEVLSIGEGRIIHARHCMNNYNFIEAYQILLSVHLDKRCSEQIVQTANFELANLILSGHVTLLNGMLSTELTEATEKLSTKNRNKIGQDTEIMNARAKHALVYILDDNSHSARVLKNRIEQLINGNKFVEPNYKFYDSGITVFSCEKPLDITTKDTPSPAIKICV